MTKVLIFTNITLSTGVTLGTWTGAIFFFTNIRSIFGVACEAFTMMAIGITIMFILTAIAELTGIFFRTGSTVVSYKLVPTTWNFVTGTCVLVTVVEAFNCAIGVTFTC